MQIINKISENKNLVLALGFFDGVHIAHKEIILKTVKLAKENNLKSGIITFEKSPYFILSGKEPEYLMKKDEKISVIENLGIDYLYLLDFEEFKNMSADDYLQNVLIKNFSPKFIITGFNHTFGLNRSGTSNFLKNHSKSYQYIEIGEMKSGNKTVSSTNIKNFIKEGEIKKANEMLGRNFSVSGYVIKGNQIARKLGYKTANILWDKETVKPKYGVYSGFAIFENIKYKALINFGIRPSIDKTLTETLEVHILNFNKDVYDKKLTVEFSSRIRDEIKFNSLEDLKTQIDKDFKSIA